MPNIPEVMIKNFHSILKEELPSNAVIGRPIITTDTSEMFIGTGESTPIVQITEIMIVDKESDLTLDIGTVLKMYITKDSNKHFFFYNGQYVRINGLGNLQTFNNYSNLPLINEIEGFFVVKSDETNSNVPTVYFYDKTTSTYKRLGFANFKDTFLTVKVNEVDIKAKGSNCMLNLKSGNLIKLKSDNITKEITIEQKASIDVEMEMKTYQMISGVKAVFPVAMDGLNVGVANGKIYSFSGRANTSSFPTTVYSYDTVNGWKNLGLTTPFSRGFMSVETYKDKIYLCGGYYYSTTPNNYVNLYEFDPLTNTFTEKASMNQKGHAKFSAVIGDKLWCIGGVHYTTTSTTSYIDSKVIEYYDFLTNTWTLLDATHNMPIPTYGGATFVIGTKIYCVGGYSKTTSAYKNVNQVFDTETLTWETKAVYPMLYNGQKGIAVNGLGYVMGGHPSTGLSTSNYLYVYVPETDKWIQKYSMVNVKTNFGIALYNNSIYTISGGYYYNNSSSSAYSRHTAVEVYTPVYDTEDKDYQVILRKPQVLGVTTTVSNMLNGVTGELGRNMVLENGKSWEYGDWTTTGTVEVLVKRFNY